MASKTGGNQYVIDVTEQTFEAEVIRKSAEVPVVLDFWAPWCGPCRQLGPLLEELAEEYQGRFILAKINTDECQELAAYFQIEGIPAVFAVAGSKIVNSFTGLMPKSALVEFLDSFVPPAPDGELETAKNLEESQPEDAEAMYRQKLAEDESNEEARLGLARLLVVKHQYDEARELIAPIGESGDYGPEALRLKNWIELAEKAPKPQELATLQAKLKQNPEDPKLLFEMGNALASQGQYTEALDKLLLAAELDRKLARNEVKELMVQIFHIVGIRSELADEYRAKLQSLLY